MKDFIRINQNDQFRPGRCLRYNGLIKSSQPHILTLSLLFGNLFVEELEIRLVLADVKAGHISDI